MESLQREAHISSAIAQLARAPGSKSGHRRFESDPPHHVKHQPNLNGPTARRQHSLEGLRTARRPLASTRPSRKESISKV